MWRVPACWAFRLSPKRHKAAVHLDDVKSMVARSRLPYAIVDHVNRFWQQYVVEVLFVIVLDFIGDTTTLKSMLQQEATTAQNVFQQSQSSLQKAVFNGTTSAWHQWLDLHPAVAQSLHGRWNRSWWSKPHPWPEKSNVVFDRKFKGNRQTQLQVFGCESGGIYLYTICIAGIEALKKKAWLVCNPAFANWMPMWPVPPPSDTGKLHMLTKKLLKFTKSKEYQACTGQVSSKHGIFGSNPNDQISRGLKKTCQDKRDWSSIQ